jgi:glycosyltransferase involved in cell wall biosynthesis
VPVPAAQRLAIAQVTPFAWEATNEVNAYVARVSDELARRGHRVLIIAPSHSAALVRDSRRALRSHPARLLDEVGDDGARVLGVGEVLPFAPARRRAASLPVDVARTIEEALTALPFDVVNVHEPFAPSAAGAALRHSRALNVGSFHTPTERILSTQLTGPLSRLVFARMDARTASFAATRNLLQRFFPGDYTVIRPGADAPRRRPPNPVPELVLLAVEERAALRLVLRALRELPEDLDWHATIFWPRPTAPPATLSRRLRDRITFAEAPETTEAEVLATADIAIFASDGDRAAPGSLIRALGAGALPVVSRLPAYEEVLGDGERGLMFEPGETQTLSAHLQRLIADPQLPAARARGTASIDPSLSWSRTTDELEAIYLGLAARRRDPAGDRSLRARLAPRPVIDVDLHMHTDHSNDCSPRPGRGGSARSRSPTTTRSPAPSTPAPRPMGSRSSSGRRSRPPSRARSSACSSRRRFREG